MKNLFTLIACVCVMLTSASAQDHAPLNDQQKKPLLFSSLPDRIPVATDYINSLFGAEAGRGVSLNIPTDVAGSRFEGRVLTSGSEYDNRIQSVVIGSTNFAGARFTVSRIVTEQGEVRYTGRIISFQHGDAYELKNEAGNLILVKKNFYSLVNE